MIALACSRLSSPWHVAASGGGEGALEAVRLSGSATGASLGIVPLEQEGSMGPRPSSCAGDPIISRMAERLVSLDRPRKVEKRRISSVWARAVNRLIERPPRSEFNCG